MPKILPVEQNKITPKTPMMKQTPRLPRLPRPTTNTAILFAQGSQPTAISASRKLPQLLPPQALPMFLLLILLVPQPGTVWCDYSPSSSLSVAGGAASRDELPLSVHSIHKRSSDDKNKSQDDNGNGTSSSAELVWDCPFPIEGLSVGDCNFTVDVGRYNVYNWHLGTGRNAFWLGGPNVDAKGDREGGYAFFDTSRFFEPDLTERGFQKRAWLMSDLDTPTEAAGRCLDFKFNLQGLDIGALSLIRVDLIKERERLEEEEVKDGAEEKEEEEGGGLNSEKESAKKTDKEDGKGGNASDSDAGTTADATGSGVGGAAGSSSNVEDLLNQADPSGRTSPFGFHFPSRRARSVELDKYRLRTNQVWSHSDPTSAWSRGHLSYATPNAHLFIWEVTPRMGGSGSESGGQVVYYKGFVALDGVQVTEGACLDECNFDMDFCNLEDSSQENGEESAAGGSPFSWRLSRGSLKASTGPIKDQGSTQMGGSSGGYAFIDSAFPRRPGDRALLRQKDQIQIEPDQPRCLQFWVSLFGSGIGSLRLLVNSSSALEDENAARWELVNPSSEPRDLWNQGRLTLASADEAEEKISVSFEATVGEVGQGDIAIDSVSIQDGPCPIHPDSAWPKSQSNPSADCTFGTGFCHWIDANVPYDENQLGTHQVQPLLAERVRSMPLKLGLEQPQAVQHERSSSSSPLWNRLRGGTAGAPLGHNSFLRGHDDYLLSFDTRNYLHEPLDSAFFLSPLITSRQVEGNGTDRVLQKCVGFWFYMAANIATIPYLGSLKLFEVEANATSETISQSHKHILWSLTNHQRPIWQYGQVSFSPGPEGKRLAFQGVRASTVLGTIAIDDITVFDGNCSVKPAKAATDPHDCSFETSYCSWAVVNPGAIEGESLRNQDWKIASRRNQFNGLKDHTFGLENRGFLYFDTANIQIMTWLVSSALSENIPHCLTFWFSAAAVEGSNLSVKRQYENGTSRLVWRVSHEDAVASSAADSSPTSWISGQVALPETDTPTLIILEGNSKNGGFALDDIRLMKNVAPSSCQPRPDYQSVDPNSPKKSLFQRRTEEQQKQQRLSVKRRPRQIYDYRW